jgi:ketosteroid isomerase-like protein
VIGHDEADVKPTSKSYAADWVQVFTLKDEKIISVQVFMDTKKIADAFEK